MKDGKENREREASKFLTLSGIAAFFSGVTATMLQLQFSLAQTPTTTDEAIAAFWVISIILSAASTVYSLLGTRWNRLLRFDLSQLLRHLILIVISKVCKGPRAGADGSLPPSPPRL